MSEAIFKVPLYHGTSTLFLEDILTLGLGGKNPIADLYLLDCISDILPLIKQYLAHTTIYKRREQVFASMAEQRSNPHGMNFQHGQTYLSPSRDTAVRYATNKRYGSEILTYTLDFLQALIDRDVPGVCDDLYRKYPRIFGLLDISPAPILLQLDSVAVEALTDEFGNAPQHAVEKVEEIVSEYPDKYEQLLQQTNFRLTQSVVPARIWLVNVRNWLPSTPDYTLYDIRRCHP